MFIVLSSWQRVHQVHLMNVSRTSPSGRRPKTKPDDFAVSSPVQAARVYTHRGHLLLLLSPKADTHFTIPRSVEG